MKTAFNKLLNILGAQDYLHFPPERTQGLRILAMDGGGTRALVTLEVLKRIEEITGQKITDLFDLIVGTSTGGILASLVGIRQYPLGIS
jgi:patatin-like phospholipase/acyl hydrolase